ncbi:MAG: N-acetylmuramoyl-L-alanine amidase [Clostridia bacterium]|nr:N-acetylmuramoyl-L-alanine amidase [Clostridia bacterium]
MKSTGKERFLFLNKLFWFIAALAAVIAILHGILSHFDKERNASDAIADALPPEVILDPGHGGADPGALSVHGAEEKDLNLKVAKAMGAFLEEAGVRVLYTRTDDVMLTHPDARTNKQGDLMGRVALAKDNPDALFVSVHMNTLPQEQYSGLQVFYAKDNIRGRVLAQTLQNLTRELLQPDNRREVKEAGSSIFILDRIDNQAVLVECGFLSNREEAALLADEGYQKKLGFVLSRGILEVLRDKGG